MSRRYERTFHQVYADGKNAHERMFKIISHILSGYEIKFKDMKIKNSVRYWYTTIKQCEKCETLSRRQRN